MVDKKSKLEDNVRLTKEKPFKFPGKEFVEEISPLSPPLKTDKTVHQERERLVCDVEGCDKSFKVNKNLWRHKRVDHGLVPENSSSQVVECEVCGKRCGDSAMSYKTC